MDEDATWYGSRPRPIILLVQLLLSDYNRPTDWCCYYVLLLCPKISLLCSLAISYSFEIVHELILAIFGRHGGAAILAKIREI